MIPLDIYLSSPIFYLNSDISRDPLRPVGLTSTLAISTGFIPTRKKMHISSGGVAVLAVTIIFTSVAFLVVVARIYTRAALVKTLGAEDYIIIVAMVASIIYLAVVIIQVKTGIGEPVSLANLMQFLEAVWGTAPVYFISLGLSKISIIVQCLRIFSASTTRRVLYAFLIFTIIYTTWAVLSAIFNCVPPQAAWGAAKAKGKCLNAESVGFANAALNIFSDICTLIIPIPQLRKLQIPRKQRVILITVFSCGGFACITSIIRLYSFWTISTASNETKSIKAVDIAIWSGIEINLGIICASVPTLKPLAARIIPKLLNSSYYDSSGRLYGNDRSTRSKVTGHFSRNTRLGDSRMAPIDNTIKVQQSIELSIVPVTPHCADDSDKLSQDGSQNELVDGKGWHPAKLEGGGARGSRWEIGQRND